MEENKDYYSILGLNKNASDSDIKKAYRKLAAKYHPDKFATKTEEEKKEAEEKFKKINEANAVLSDPEKKKNYDQFGDPNGPTMNGGFDPFSDMDPFGMGGFGFGNRFRQKPQVDRGEDIQIVVKITLEEVLKGVNKTITYNKKTACTHCKGTGNVSGKLDTCTHCNGTGRIREIKQEGYMTMVNETVCHHCHGTGRISNGPKCSACNGKGYENQKVEKTISIPKGVETGMATKQHGEGSESLRGGINGDLIIIFEVIEHSVFKRNGGDLIMDLELNLDEAWCGCKKEITCLDGSKINVTIPELTEHGKILRVPNKGLTTLQNYNNGSLYLQILYKTPKKLNKKQKELIQEFYKN
jgi:molecular chaperone DnaJ